VETAGDKKQKKLMVLVSFSDLHLLAKETRRKGNGNCLPVPWSRFYCGILIVEVTDK
jgi:hypothetical protein